MGWGSAVGDAGMPVGCTAIFVGLDWGGFCAITRVEVTNFVAVGAEVLRQ